MKKPQSPKPLKLNELTNLIKPGYRIFLGTGCSEPVIISKELVRKKYRWFDCRLIHYLTLSDLKYFSENHSTHFRHQTLSIIASELMRKAVNQGKSDFVPIKSSDIPRLLKKGAIPIDLAFLQVSPPDKYGYCSLGINVDINYTVAKTAKKLVFQINRNMPYTSGNSCIRFDDADYYIEHNTSLLEYPMGLKFTLERHKTDQNIKQNFSEKIMKKIGFYVARLIEDESTLNVGLGKLPPLIWKYLESKRDLAIYSEVLVLNHEFFDLLEKGVISCSKNIYTHIMTSFAVGSEKYYSKLNRNPFFEFHPTEFITNIHNIARNNKPCSIYSAIAVDLTGQITNHLSNSFYSGIGGELDFIQATALNPQGKTIIILPSTTKKCDISRIVPLVVRSSIPASDVHYVVTEWGIARLAGRNIRERALQLIGIAHPKFRKELLNEAKRMHLIYEDQILPTSIDGHIALYPNKYEWLYETPQHEFIEFRPVKPTDESLLQDFFYHLDETSRRLRFLVPKKIFPHEQTQLEVNIDYYNTMVIIGLIGDEDREEEKKIICAGSYYREISGNTNWAEMATVVSNKWQRKGIGTHIFKRLIEIAIENGVTGFYGEISPQNTAILAILNKLPYEVKVKTQSDLIEFRIEFTVLA
ncbi:MAG: GNAT family N-acetyltransferase [Candidatus Lokiarchaeota archaeon]|nr:GNAT family N-acetyltransferase [Candidatus Harpocratesius repetitus]